MAKYHAVDGIYRKVAKKYTPVEGVYRNVTKAFEPVDGVYRQYFSSGVPAETLAVGDSVWLNVNGAQTEFLVVHQGNPDSARYDASCDGTWLLMKNLHTNRNWDTTNNDYENSDIHSYLNTTFHNHLDSVAQSAIKQVKIPYNKGNGWYGSVKKLSDGLSTKIFLLSGRECGATTDTTDFSLMPADGTCLDYFSGTAATDSKRIAYNSYGDKAAWYMRTPKRESSNQWVWLVSTVGMIGFNTITSNLWVRPAFILDSSTLVDQSTGINIIV